MHSVKMTTEYFDHLYTTYFERLYYYAYSFLDDGEISRDIVNEVFAQVWDHHDDLKSTTVVQYLYVSIRNLCLDVLRRRKVEDSYLKQITAASAMVEELSTEEFEQKFIDMQHAVEKLSVETQKLLSDHYLHGKHYSEIATELKISPETVKKRIYKALKDLRSLLNVSKT